MSKSNLHETAYLKLVFQNVPMANIGDAGGLQPSAVAGNFYLALYTSDPTDTDSGVETTYTGYARVAIPRSVVGFSVTDNIVSNLQEGLFPVSIGGSEVVSHWGLRTALAGGDLLGSGALTGSVTVDIGDTPRVQAGLMTITED
jgi:hypothetical protein